jgi:hypothetical protein
MTKNMGMGWRGTTAVHHAIIDVAASLLYGSVLSSDRNATATRTQSRSVRA